MAARFAIHRYWACGQRSRRSPPLQIQVFPRQTCRTRRARSRRNHLPQPRFRLHRKSPTPGSTAPNQCRTRPPIPPVQTPAGGLLNARPEVTGDTVNSAVVITAESATSYPGPKSAADYMGPLTELTTSKGFKADGGPHDSPSAPRLSCAVTSPVSRDRSPCTRSSLIVLRKGFVISFYLRWPAAMTRSMNSIEKLSADTLQALTFSAPNPFETTGYRPGSRLENYPFLW